MNWLNLKLQKCLADLYNMIIVETPNSDKIVLPKKLKQICCIIVTSSSSLFIMVFEFPDLHVVHYTHFEVTHLGVWLHKNIRYMQRSDLYFCTYISLRITFFCLLLCNFFSNSSQDIII